MKGVQWMVEMADANIGVLLADEMGLGKTIQALGVLVARCKKPGWALVITLCSGTQ